MLDLGKDNGALTVTLLPRSTPEMIDSALRVTFGYARDVEEARMFMALLGFSRETLEGGAAR